MARPGSSLGLFRISMGVLLQNRALVVFPLVSFAAWTVIVASFAVPVVNFSRHGQPGPVGWILIACMYLVLACVTIFCNAALIFCADQALRGGRPTVSAGFRAAGRRTGVIVEWAVASSTISVVIRAAEQRLGPLGEIVGALAGVAWGMVTYLVLPLMVLENLGPLDAARRSVQMLKATWGQRLIGAVGMGWIGVVLFLPSIFLFALCAALFNDAGAVAGGLLMVAWLFVLILTMTAVSGIYQTALYRFAADGGAPVGFAADDLSNAFNRRRRGLFRR